MSAEAENDDAGPTTMTFDDLSRWLRGDALEIVLLAVGSVLMARFVRWVIARLLFYVERRGMVDDDEALVLSEARKHERALAQIASWTLVVFIYLVAAVLVLERFNVPITSLVAPAAVVGAAIGFGAQRLVQDLLSGFFIFTERQFGYGDIVRISQPGERAGIVGTVEEVTLRTTRLSTESGELIVIPNGEIRQVTNLSKDWARVVLDLPLALDSDIASATEILRRIGDEMAADEYWSRMLLDPPT